nr:hypothetical protein [Tanacetum cinerariifolium]
MFNAHFSIEATPSLTGYLSCTRNLSSGVYDHIRVFPPAKETSVPLKDALVNDVYKQIPCMPEDHIISKTSKRNWDAAFGSSFADTYTPDDQLSVQNKQHVNQRVNIVEPGPIE